MWDERRGIRAATVCVCVCVYVCVCGVLSEGMCTGLHSTDGNDRDWTMGAWLGVTLSENAH